MIQDLVSALEFTNGAQWALGLFVGAFVLIFYSAMRLSQSASDRFASIPLSDDLKDPRSE